MTDDEREEDVDLFERIEFDAFLNYASIFAPVEKVLEGLHRTSEFGLSGTKQYKGHTPIEVAWAMHNFWDMETAVKELVIPLL